MFTVFQELFCNAVINFLVYLPWKKGTSETIRWTFVISFVPQTLQTIKKLHNPLDPRDNGLSWVLDSDLMVSTTIF